MTDIRPPARFPAAGSNARPRTVHIFCSICFSRSLPDRRWSFCAKNTPNSFYSLAKSRTGALSRST